MSEVAIERHLPGLPSQRNAEGKVVFVWGRVEQVTEYSILIKTDSKFIGQASDQGYVRLIGETYIFWCPRCEMSVWEVERIRSCGACPKCKQGLWALQLGDKVRLHHRTGMNKPGYPDQGMWGAWYGEKWAA